MTVTGIVKNIGLAVGLTAFGLAVLITGASADELASGVLALLT